MAFQASEPFANAIVIVVHINSLLQVASALTPFTSAALETG